MNELSRETSPYLLQHAANPVHWKAWNERSLALAKKLNKLLIISVGYSACHWCHVMEHETFEDHQAAHAMNAHFVCIKVDREERPDIDAVYMKAVQIMTGRGGWPMNVVALPDGRPIWGGTYFRKNEWISILGQLHELYESNPEKMLDYAEKLQAGIESLNYIAKPTREPQKDAIAPLVKKWKKSFDHEFGGMARAPKFMMPDNLKFMMHYGQAQNDTALLEFVDLTLTRMAYGGLFDTIGGGFSRYSVDMKWHVPHFEKMLYDNGQLVSLYADAYKRTQNPLYREVVEKTLSFTDREWLTADGAFYSALDADSLDSKGRLTEGAFYVWTLAELQQLLKKDFALFSVVFNVNDFGYWEHDNYVLIRTEPIENIAKEAKVDAKTLNEKKQLWEKTLYDAREKRSKPRLDDKCLTSWNALMLKGYCDAYKALGHTQYLETALRNAAFIKEKQWSADGHLWHSFKSGSSTINGFLEDYALVTSGFIALHEITLEQQWLDDAKKLTDYALDHFFDTKQQLFSFTSDLDQALIARHFETEDNVIAASNSVMADNLHRLGIYFSNPHYSALSVKMVQQILPAIDYPSAFSNWLSLAFTQSGQGRELAICGSDALQYAAKINAHYNPGLILAGALQPGTLPFLEHRFSAGKTLLYLCRDNSCEAPQESPEQILEML